MPTDTPATPFVVDDAHKAIGQAIAGLVKAMFAGPDAAMDPEAGKQFMESLTGALTAGSSACVEVKRITAAVTQLRDSHRPRPHLDPTAAGALCEACSLTGALVAWPCGAWTGAEQILAHNQP
jgi:hypothetical protein